MEIKTICAHTVGIINRIEYDELTNRFLGVCLPLQNGIPQCNAFILDIYENIKDAVAKNAVAKYAHCILAQPGDGVALPSIIFVLGTESKYDFKVIQQRWDHIEAELLKRNIRIVSFGADGAGSFMKAMIHERGIFLIRSRIRVSSVNGPFSE